MILSKSHFALQLPFAQRVAAVTGLPLGDALLRHSQFYNVGLRQGWDFDAANPVWQAFLAALHEGADPVDYVYERAFTVLLPHGDAHGRCFNYQWEAETRTVRLHFANNAPDGIALRESEIPARQAELRDLFAAVATEHPEAERVRGASWLYNLPAYRRLFPPEYVAAIRPGEREYIALGLWGQFLDRHEEVKPQLGDCFLARVAAAQTMDDLAACFPLDVLATSCEITHFYCYYETR